MRLLLPAAVFLAALSFGCGGDSEADEVEAVLRSYIQHYVDSKPDAMYALLDSTSQSNCSETNFVAFMSAAREALGDRGFEIIEVRDIVVEGNEATATVESEIDGAARDTTENALVKEGSDWKLKLPSTVC